MSSRWTGMKCVWVEGLLELMVWMTGSVALSSRARRKMVAGWPWARARAVSAPMPPAVVPVMRTRQGC